MRTLALQDSRTPEVQSLANWLGSVETIESWLRETWVVIPDPQTAEYIRAPRYQILCRMFQGDCDDAATLAASLLTVLGVPSELVAVRQSHESEFSHVFLRSGRVVIDPIVPAHLLPIIYAEEMTVPV